MENLLADILLIERKALCSFLIKNDVSADRFQLWRNLFKPAILDRKLGAIETMLLEMDICTSIIRCRRCNSPLKWVDMDLLDADEIFFMCPECIDSKPILKCNIEETVKILMDFIDQENPQIIASAFKLMMISANILNSISPPEIPDNPFKIFKSIFENSSNFLKFGGTKAVIMADIFEDNELSEFPILYIADTISIPTRYLFHVLKFKSQIFNPGNKKNDENIVNLPRYQEEYLVKELTEIANLYIKPESYLVLGKQLQNLISPEYYNCSRHNLSIIVPFRSLCPLDKYSKHRFNVTENFEKIVTPAVTICYIVQTVLKDSNKVHSHELSYKHLKLYLTVVSWLLTFHDTPFEAMLYHIIQSKMS